MGLVGRLEREGPLVLERGFRLEEGEIDLLSPALSEARAKNISLAPGGGAVRHASAAGETAARLAALMERYADWAGKIVGEIAPSYRVGLQRGRTSFRPRGAEDTAPGPRKDDRRLHIDAFASQPTGGRRILRVFSNINPAGQARVWRVGEPFEDHARRWLRAIRRPWPGEALALRALRITRGRRTPYDHLMLGLHNRSKLDADYQRNGPSREVGFPAGTSWIVFTDSTVHAAVTGRYALEQTFYLPVAAMADEAASPLRVLERLTGRRLA